MDALKKWMMTFKYVPQPAMTTYALSSMVSQDHVWPYEFAPVHSRRIFTEEKAKVVAAIWKIELIKILAVLSTMCNRLI